MTVAPFADAAFLNAVELIYDAAADPGMWPAALHAIASRFNAAGAVLIWQRDDGKFGTVASEGIAEAQRDYIENGWSARDIRAMRSLERGYFFNGEPFGDRHICSQEELAREPFYTQFLARHHLGWFGAVAVSPDPHVAVALSLQRDPRVAPHFDEDELKAIAQLGRYVEKSLRLSIQLIDAEVSRIGLAEALTTLGVGVFVLDSLGRVIFYNQQAEAKLGDAIRIEHDRLLLGSRAENTAFQNAITGTLRAEPPDLLADPKPVVVQRAAPLRPLVIYPMSLKPGADVKEDFIRRAKALAVVIEPKADEPADPALVRDFLGLTLGEARVASLIGSGLAPKEASTKLGVAEETVRTVLKRVFAKTGVGRQAELATLLAKLSLAGKLGEPSPPRKTDPP